MEEEFHLIEQGKPLSQSVIWELQSKFYRSERYDVWNQGLVPSLITTNAFIARQYARLIYCYINDIKSKEKVTIIELGAGHGRFGFLCLKQLIDMSRQAGMPLNVRYVMTDFAEKSVESWQMHPGLKSMVSQGMMDFALFDADKDDALQLVVSGERIDKDKPSAHTIVIANYFFDSLPLDYFQIDSKSLYSCMPEISMEYDPEEIVDVSKPLLQEIRLKWELDKVFNSSYSDPLSNQIIAKYLTELDQVTFSIPTTTVRVIKVLDTMTREGLFLITADKGYHQLRQFGANKLPQKLIYGKISFRVNYHFLNEWFQASGGRSWQSKFENSHLDLSLFTTKKRPYPAVSFYYNEMVEKFSPLDFHNINRDKAKRTPLPDMRYCLSLIRLSNYDPTTFYYLRRALRENIDDISRDEEAELLNILPRVAQMYYKIEDDDVLYVIGQIYQRLKQYRAAIDYYQQSISMFGAHYRAYVNIAECYYGLRKYEQAMRNIHFSLSINPDNISAVNWKKRIEKKL